MQARRLMRRKAASTASVPSSSIDLALAIGQLQRLNGGQESRRPASLHGLRLLVVIDEEDASLKQCGVVLLSNDLVPDGEDVTMERVKGSKQGGPVLNAAVLKSRSKIHLWSPLRASHEDVSLNAWEKISQERISACEVLVTSLDHFPGDRLVLGLELDLTAVDSFDGVPIDVRHRVLAKRTFWKLGEELVTLLIAAKKLISLLPLADLTGATSTRVRTGDLSKSRRTATANEPAGGVSLDDIIMANLTVPGRETNVKASNVSSWKPLDLLNGVPILDPLAALAGNVPANPTTLRLTTEVNATENHGTYHELA
jgi:hypothetical protein